MAFNSRTFRILIASPSDVTEEREIAVRVIQDWNDLYSHLRNVVLLPLRWETHTAPEFGVRPQEAINRAIVDDCDLLIGMFSTRIGTATGVAESGTLEEIERVAKAGKPVMLYFSKVGADPDLLDLEQLRRLREFKADITSHALIESYKSTLDFRDKLTKQLEMKVRDLQNLDNPNQPPPLKLLLGGISPDPHDGPYSVNLEIPRVTDLSALEGLPPEGRKAVLDALETAAQLASSVGINLAIENSGSSGIRNPYAEVSIRAVSGSIKVIDPTSLNMTFTLLKVYAASDDFERDSDASWHDTFEWSALQAKRKRLIRSLLVRSTVDAAVEFSAKVFADNFAEPFILSESLTIVARLVDRSLDDVLPSWKEIAATAKADSPLSALYSDALSSDVTKLYFGKPPNTVDLKTISLPDFGPGQG